MATLALKSDGDAILLIGGLGSHLGQSTYLREMLGREEGAPPPVDLALEKRHGDFVRNLINSSQVTAVHDISDGGLAATVIEMALASGLGAKLDAMNHEALFGEDQARYVMTCKPTEAAKINPGEMYPYLNEEENGWYKIEYEADKEGWVSGTYVDLVK